MKGEAFINNERKNSEGKDVCTYIKATVRYCYYNVNCYCYNVYVYCYSIYAYYQY